MQARSSRVIGTLLILVLAGLSVWAGWTYRTTETRVRDIDSRLPSEQALDAMSLEDSVEALKLAMIQCNRVASLQANPLARLLRGDEIKSLAQHCELIKSRQDTLQGP
jgi:hypothetical protein